MRTWKATLAIVLALALGLPTHAAAELAANSVTASKINVSTLSAISGNIGTITAGTISGITITGVTITGTTSISGATITGGSLSVGGGAFVVNSIGQLQVNNATISGLLDVDAGAALRLSYLAGAGARTLCVSNLGNVYTVASGVAC